MAQGRLFQAEKNSHRYLCRGKRRTAPSVQGQLLSAASRFRLPDKSYIQNTFLIIHDEKNRLPGGFFQRGCFRFIAKKKSPSISGGDSLKKGGDILSHRIAVPSAQAGLTSLFGMGRGEPRRNNHLRLFLSRRATCPGFPFGCAWQYLWHTGIKITIKNRKKVSSCPCGQEKCA